MEQPKTTTVKLINRKTLWVLIPVLLTPFIGLFLYSKMHWWMFFCVIIVGLIQFFLIRGILEVEDFFVSKPIKTIDLKEYTRREIRLTRALQVFAIIVGILDLFPLFCQLQIMQEFPGLYYEGGVIVTLLTLVLFGLWLVVAIDIKNPKIKENLQLYKSTGKTQEEVMEETRLRNKLEKKKIREQKIATYGDGYIEIGRCGVVINDNTKKIFINSNEYGFNDILGYSVQDNSVTIYSESTTTVKTNTGSMIGRAAIGGVLLGGTGAIIGGTTAKRDIHHSSNESTIIHDYSVVITVNNINSPNEIVKVGQNNGVLNRITSTLTVILHNNSNQ